MQTENKVFQIEFCKEDAQRIITALELLKKQSYELISNCKDDVQCDVAWLEWSYVVGLIDMLEYKFDLDGWK